MVNFENISDLVYSDSVIQSLFVHENRHLYTIILTYFSVICDIFNNLDLDHRCPIPY